jgi:regulator of cell morphogenesis and NO signaling
MTDTKTTCQAMSCSADHVDPAWSINTLLERYPQAISVINANGIDTCCGGTLPIQEVALRHKMDLVALLSALDQVASAAHA